MITFAEQFLQGLGCPYDKDAAGRITVRGDVDLSARSLKELPDLSEVIVKGNFICRYNQLTSLKGSPLEVRGIYFCNGNKLTSLEHAPAVVGGTFFCNQNSLVTLEGAPKKFHRLESDFGNFLDWSEVPAHLRTSAASRERELRQAVEEATVLQHAITAHRPLKLKSPSL